MPLPINNFFGFVIPGIIFLALGTSFLLLLLALLSVVKSFFQKRGRVVGEIIFNEIEEYAVVVINDKTNSIGNAVSALRMIGISEKMAFDFTLRIHEEGIAIVWTGARNEAWQYVQIIRQNGLRCFITAIQE
jgi:ATP-dependent Clp protease adapter protein ClpS